MSPMNMTTNNTAAGAQGPVMVSRHPVLSPPAEWSQSDSKHMTHEGWSAITRGATPFFILKSSYLKREAGQC